MSEAETIIIREIYGSNGNENIFIEDEKTSTLKLVQKKTQNSILEILQKIFLPQGYPDSVSADYMSYQIWDTAQAFCSTITGILATQEVLRGVGVGDTNATALAATITWVIKDGCGHIGRIVFAWSHGTYLDAYSKKWRLYADLLNDAAMCAELALPLFKSHTTSVLCITTMMKSVVGVAGGATRAALTQHHARRGNLGDVAAKDSAQETAVNLIASFVAIFFLNFPRLTLPIFSVLVTLHMLFNYMAVRSVCLRTLNEPRYLEVIRGYICNKVMQSPCAVNAKEPVFLTINDVSDIKVCGFSIKMGSSLNHNTTKILSSRLFKFIKKIYWKYPYIIFPDISTRNLHVHLFDYASNEDILRVYFHAVLLAVTICHKNEIPLEILSDTQEKNSFRSICTALTEAKWEVETETFLKQKSPDDLEREQSAKLFQYVCGIVNKEWKQFYEAMVKTGWCKNNHLLMVDEWRLSKSNVDVKDPLTKKVD